MLAQRAMADGQLLLVVLLSAEGGAWVLVKVALSSVLLSVLVSVLVSVLLSVHLSGWLALSGRLLRCKYSSNSPAAPHN